MLIAVLAHLCPCGGQFLPDEVSVTEEKELRVFGKCSTCGHKVAADTPLTELYKLALMLKAQKLEEICQRLLPPLVQAEDTKWLHEMGIGG